MTENKEVNKLGIVEVRKRIATFMSKELEKEGLPITILEVRKVDEEPVSWIARVQIVEESEYVKALGLGTTVYNRNIYELTMDENMEILSFKRTEPFTVTKSVGETW
ncbi:MAG TPA: hypothetical protein ACFYD6_11185 [Candidatus Brocadiia bacterium]|nr:hypothetical protein [Candidatus Brocadiales bacterium]